MKITNAKVGDKCFGIIYKYSFRFLKGIRVVEFEVVKVNPKTVNIAWDRDSRKYPQLVKKDWDKPTINTNKKTLLQDYIFFLDTSNFPKSLKDKLRKYCLRKIREIKEVERT